MWPILSYRENLMHVYPVVMATKNLQVIFTPRSSHNVMMQLQVSSLSSFSLFLVLKKWRKRIDLHASVNCKLQCQFNSSKVTSISPSTNGTITVKILHSFQDFKSAICLFPGFHNRKSAWIFHEIFETYFEILTLFHTLETLSGHDKNINDYFFFWTN